MPVLGYSSLYDSNGYYSQYDSLFGYSNANFWSDPYHYSLARHKLSLVRPSIPLTKMAAAPLTHRTYSDSDVIQLWPFIS